MEHMNYTYRKKQARLGTLLALLAIAIALFTNLHKPNVINAKNTLQPQSKRDLSKELVFKTASNGIKNIAIKIGTITNTTNAISTEWSEEERYYLAKIAMAESEGESTEGKAMVIKVILNRVESEDFPDTIQEVIFQNNNGTYQFSPLEPGGRWWTIEPDEDCYAAVNMIMVDKWDESQGALYFESIRNGKNTWHSRNLEYIKTIGNHNFYK